MNINPRDRRKWFAVNFGCNHFRSAPLHTPSIAFALGIPLLAMLIVSAAVMFGHGGNGLLLAAGPVLSLKELREKAARAINAAAAIRDDSRSWEGEKQTAFDAAVKDATDAQKEIQTTELRESNMANLAAMEQQTGQATSRITEPGTAGAETHAENFGRFLKIAKYNFKKDLVEAKGFSSEAVAACIEKHREVFRAYLRADSAGVREYARQNDIGPREVQALLSNDLTLGGALCPEDVKAEIIRAEAGYAVLVGLCRTENTSRDSLVFPKLKAHATDQRRTSGFAGKFQQQGYVTGGTAPTIQDQPTFQRERIPVHSWQPDAIEVSPELLEDSDANLESIIAEAIGEALGFDKDDKILAGTGVLEPEGVLNAGITTVNSAGATSIAIGGIIGLYTELPAQYRGKATFVMASRTMGAILQLNTGTGGVYLFPPNQWNNTILGRPVVFLDYGMDTATAAGGTTFTAGQFPIIFGDWKRYIIAQRAALRIQRLVERFAPNVGFLPTARLGGQVVLTDAFRILKIAA